MYRLPAAAPASSSAALTSPSTTLFPSATPLSPLLRSFFSYSEGRRGVADGKGRSRRGSALLWSTGRSAGSVFVGARGRSAGSIGSWFWRPGRIVRADTPDALGDFRMIPRLWRQRAGVPTRTILPGRHFPPRAGSAGAAFSAWAARSCEPPGGSPAGIGAMPRAAPGTPGTTRTAPAVSARSRAAPGTPRTTRRIRPARRARCALSAGFACRFRRFRGPGPPLTGARWRRCPRARTPAARTGPGLPC